MILTDRQAACDLAQAGWPTPLIPLMVAIGHRESGLNTDAVNRDPSVASAPPTGWLQVRAFPERTRRWNLLDPVQNAQAGYAVYQDQGIGAWTTHRAAEGDLSAIQAALADWSPTQCGPAAGSSTSSTSGTGIPEALRKFSDSFLAGGQVVAGLVTILVAGLLLLQASGQGGAVVRGIARTNPLLRALT